MNKIERKFQRKKIKRLKGKQIKTGILLILFLVFPLIMTINLVLEINFIDSEKIENLYLKNSLSVAWEDDGTLIHSTTEIIYDYQMITDGEGGVIISWADDRSSDIDIYAQKINSEGQIQWEANGTVVCNVSGIQFKPQIVSDGEGGAIVIWEHWGTYYKDLYAQRINSIGQLQWNINGVPICTAYNNQRNHQVISNGQGGAIIVWEDERTGDYNYDIYAQCINSTGYLQWISDCAVCTSENIQKNPCLSCDGEGGAVIVWQDNRSQNGFDIYAQRINLEGLAQWIPNGVVICSDLGTQGEIQITNISSEGVAIAWSDDRNGNLDIYAQFVNMSGISQWSENGTIVCNAQEDQISPQICSDGSGGAIMTWEDYRTPYDAYEWSNIYAQKMDSNGNAQWTPNGFTVCNNIMPQLRPKIVSDGSGGAIIAWEDMRRGTHAIYAQWVNSSGYSKWVSNGTNICGTYTIQYNIQLVSDGSGGAIIALQGAEDAWSYFIAQRKRPNDAPSVKIHPEDFIVSTKYPSTIIWSLTDDSGLGEYRVIANDSSGNYNTKVDWTIWRNDEYLYVYPENLALGVFNFTIEYRDNDGEFGQPDTVIITVTYNVTRPIPGYDSTITIFVLIISVLSIVIIFIQKEQLKY
ncbi:MAG: hypothetical protein JW891_18610 [Candidatus Lokiarchaeota archaeon]|nr:hypothetical protein [Candidatus Lokiarchaeota archaeon]